MEKKQLAAVRLRQALHKPVSPYFAGVYTTLMSIVQGAALATLAFVVFECSLSTATIFKVIISWLVIGIVWHFYITHIQFVSWRLTPIDTLIPMGFGAWECWLIFSVPRSMCRFSSALTLIAIWGVLSFLNWKLNWTEGGKQLMEDHFEDRAFADEMFTETDSFHTLALVSMVAMSAIFGVGAAFSHASGLTENANSVIVGSFFIAVLLILLFKLQLRKWLNKSKTLKKKVGTGGF